MVKLQPREGYRFDFQKYKTEMEIAQLWCRSAMQEFKQEAKNAVTKLAAFRASTRGKDHFSEYTDPMYATFCIGINLDRTFTWELSGAVIVTSHGKEEERAGYYIFQQDVDYKTQYDWVYELAKQFEVPCNKSLEVMTGYELVNI